MVTPRMLLVEDDAAFRVLVLRIVTPHYRVTDVSSAEMAFALLVDGHTFDVVLCDMGLGGGSSGGDLYRRLDRRCDRHAGRFVLLSGQDVGAQYPTLAAELSGRLLRKPIYPTALLETLATVRAQASP